MSADTWKLIEWFKTNAGKSTTRLAINSNLGTQVDIDRLLAATKDVEIDLYTSNEAVGLQAEYIRDGLVWDDWANNVERLLDSNQPGLFCDSRGPLGGTFKFKLNWWPWMPREQQAHLAMICYATPCMPLALGLQLKF